MPDRLLIIQLVEAENIRWNYPNEEINRVDSQVNNIRRK
jgi:hypothetical protein